MRITQNAEAMDPGAILDKQTVKVNAIKKIKEWIITLLVFWGILKISLFLLNDVLFQFVSITDPYDMIVHMVILAMIILLSIIITVLLVRGNEK